MFIFFYFILLFKYLSALGFDDNLINMNCLMEMYLELYNLKKNSSCVKDFESLINHDKDFFSRNLNVFNGFGKNFDDIGNELECYKSNLNVDYIFLYMNLTGSNYGETLPKYLNRYYSFMGLCIPKTCVNLSINMSLTWKEDYNKTYKENFEKKCISENLIHNFVNYVSDFKVYKLSDINRSDLFVIILYFFFSYLIIKIIVGIFSKFKYSKGYQYHGFYLFSKDENLGNLLDEMERETNQLISDEDLINKINNQNSEINLNEEYNPNYDFEPFYPKFLRFIKYLDFFNNLSIFSKKRNRYYNENNIIILCSIRTLLLFYLIYSEVIRALIKLPNENVFDNGFYTSLGISFYRRSKNSLVFWTILESAIFSFKLMNYLKKKFNESDLKNDINRKEKTIFIIKQILKFFYFYIPRIISFIFIYIFFYYLFRYYNRKFENKMTYFFISKDIINKNECSKEENNLFFHLLYTFIPFTNYIFNLPEGYFETCYPFTYIYTNMFFSSLFFIMILIFSFHFQKKIIYIIITLALLANLLLSYIYYFIKNNHFYLDYSHKDENDKNEYYKFSNFSGENYSIFYPHIFFSIYYFGCLLGLCIYYYSEYKDKNINRKISNDEQSLLKKSPTITNRSAKTSKTNNKNDIVFIIYKPMEFCLSFIFKLKKSKTYIKCLLLFIYFIVSLMISILPYLLFINKQESITFFKLEGFFHPLKILYFTEKNINAFLFIFFICLIFVFPKKYKIIRALKSNFFIPISRSGFFITCTHQSLIYILFCLFQLRIKINFFIIFHIVLGLFIIIVLLSALSTILIELPLRILFKNIAKKGENEECLFALINMRQNNS